MYESDAIEKSKEHEVIYAFFVNAKNKISINEMEVDENIKKIFIKSQLHIFGDKTKEIVNSRINFANENKDQIRNYRGLIIYLIEQFFEAKNEVLEYIKNKYDCILFKPTTEFESDFKNYNNYIVFKPNQIKLADGTNTTFDGNNPDIRFKDGGSIKELSKKEKQIVIENQNQLFGDGLPMYKLSADGKWVMRLNSSTNKYNTHTKFDLFHESILDREREAYARENAKKVSEYLDNNGAELLNKSIYGSRYYIYKNNHIRVSNHHNQSEQTNKETGLSKYKSNEHNFYSYEKDGWKEMINKIELINPNIKFKDGGAVQKSSPEQNNSRQYIDYLVTVGKEDAVESYNFLNYLKSKGLSTVGLLPEEIRTDPVFKKLKFDLTNASNKAKRLSAMYSFAKFYKNRDREQQFKDRAIAKEIIDKFVQDSPNKKEFNNILMEKNKNTFSKNALKVIPIHQMKVLKSTNFSEMDDTITRINEAVFSVPKLYGQDGVPDKMIYLHYFYGNQDWYITEYDRNSHDAFGYVNLGYGAEMGYMSIPEIVENGKIELDFYFEPTLWSEIDGKKESAFEKQNKNTETKSTPIEIVQTNQPAEKKYIYKIDGVDYDLTNLKLDELHPIMILDPNSSQWKSAVKEYFAEQNIELGIISFDIKSYKNPYELNKSIEKWIDTNVGAIENVSKRTYSSEEKMFIRNYTGYGGLGKFGKTTVGSMFEFFTPTKVIKTMWALAYKYGYSSEKSILETSVGTGEFLQFASPDVRKLAYEINVYSAIITKILYPTTEVRLAPFEKMFIKDNYTIKGKVDNLEKFDMVIGNPPYGSFDVLDDVAAQYLLGMGEKAYTKANNYVEYFLRRSLDVLKPNGLIVMIVGAELKNGGNMFLDSKDSAVKDYLNENAILLDAYRLPDSTFERTGVTSDILVIQKK